MFLIELFDVRSIVEIKIRIYLIYRTRGSALYPLVLEIPLYRIEGRHASNSAFLYILVEEINRWIRTVSGLNLSSSLDHSIIIKKVPSDVIPRQDHAGESEVSPLFSPLSLSSFK
ncbi:hypothetical protein TWF706_010580 [Orbilia oligospora]|nr:hypothetical protein TWF706_010580 [Orbilia oligospora]